jgi:hypothetical protein
MSTRENADFKWKHDPTVIGALEVPRSLDVFDVHAPTYTPKAVPTCSSDFERALEIWKQVQGQVSFVKACDGMAPVTSCCGLIYNPDETIKQWVPLLNQGWATTLNKNPLLQEAGLAVSTFVWSWTNVMGETETVVLLIRFHKTKSQRDETGR